MNTRTKGPLAQVTRMDPADVGCSNCGRSSGPGEGGLTAGREAEEEIPLDESRFSLAGVQMKFSAIGSPECGLTIPVEGRGGHRNYIHRCSWSEATLPLNHHQQTDRFLSPSPFRFKSRPAPPGRKVTLRCGQESSPPAIMVAVRRIISRSAFLFFVNMSTF
jgi:hypothetical protein